MAYGRAIGIIYKNSNRDQKQTKHSPQKNATERGEGATQGGNYGAGVFLIKLYSAVAVNRTVIGASRLLFQKICEVGVGGTGA